MKWSWVYCVAVAILIALAVWNPWYVPPPSMEESAARITRTMAQTSLIGMQMHCLSHPLTKPQLDYLTHRSPYEIQHYLRAFTRPDCESRAIDACEATSPGQCIARPDE